MHQSKIPWDDQSGIQLRKWLNVSPNQFYDPKLFAIIPMGFCYPGKGKSGDLPPRKVCAPNWHDKLFQKMNSIQMILLIGQYAQKYYLRERVKVTLTETVKSYKNYLPKYFALPHPSPRNRIWLKKNPWFLENIIPELQKEVHLILSETI